MRDDVCGAAVADQWLTTSQFRTCTYGNAGFEGPEPKVISALVHVGDQTGSSTFCSVMKPPSMYSSLCRCCANIGLQLVDVLNNCDVLYLQER